MEPIKGVLVGRRPTAASDDRGRTCYDGERQLIAAIILAAVQASEKGDAEATDWLNSTGREWCEKLLGIEEPHLVRNFTEARRLVLTDPLASAQRHERDLQRWRERNARITERRRAEKLNREECYA